VMLPSIFHKNSQLLFVCDN